MILHEPLAPGLALERSFVVCITPVCSRSVKRWVPMNPLSPWTENGLEL